MSVRVIRSGLRSVALMNWRTSSRELSNIVFMYALDDEVATSVSIRAIVGVMVVHVFDHGRGIVSLYAVGRRLTNGIVGWRMASPVGRG